MSRIIHYCAYFETVKNYKTTQGELCYILPIAMLKPGSQNMGEQGTTSAKVEQPKRTSVFAKKQRRYSEVYRSLENRIYLEPVEILDYMADKTKYTQLEDQSFPIFTKFE
ncbi:hypothetical protein COY32_05930 [candidate division WWE3 bacterium CG_4_10_14_0_2_um_filter_41_14]|uniref:Uncharacterized protein n=1 Tax=candidate division WWE3 bacterium CG_4_10_14_0_2_um_filter_41_14 TaxID=1975072 RepID=A0A2M7TFV6_UNCKA|nr:MAG: hypothetical protein COY32_05930 [candidate division WWE3 bacterium CG_4_10_14_0_2_um_filter_41_14]